MNVKIATKRALTFPGRGHFYSNQKGKGFIFTGLELASLAGLAVFGSSYSTKVDEFDTAQSDYDNIDLLSGNYTSDDISRITQVRTDAHSAKNQAFSSMIGCGTSAAIIWLWNIRDVNKYADNTYKGSKSVDVGISPKGEIRISIPLN